jgi:hypothetical protein
VVRTRGRTGVEGFGGTFAGGRSVAIVLFLRFNRSAVSGGFVVRAGTFMACRWYFAVVLFSLQLVSLAKGSRSLRSASHSLGLYRGRSVLTTAASWWYLVAVDVDRRRFGRSDVKV